MCMRVSWKGREGGLKPGGGVLCMMWGRLGVLASWGWWRRLTDPEGIMVSLPAPYQPSPGVLLSLSGRQAGREQIREVNYSHNSPRSDRLSA